MTHPLSDELREMARLPWQYYATHADAHNRAAYALDDAERACIQRHDDFLVMYDRALQAEAERDALKVRLRVAEERIEAILNS